MRLPRLPVSRRRHESEQNARRKLVSDAQKWITQRDEAIERAMIAERQLEDSRERDDLIGEQRDEARARVAELEQAIRTFVTSEDTHEPGPFVKDGNWHTGPCVEGGPRMEDVYPDGFQVCADEECFAYWPCDVERLRRVLDGHDRQTPASLSGGHPSRCYVCGSSAWRHGQRIHLGGEEHWRHADCQPPKASDVRGRDRQERGDGRVVACGRPGCLHFGEADGDH